MIQRKKELRKELKAKLKGLASEEKAMLDHQVYESLFGLPEMAKVKAVYGYMALSWETGTTEILERLWRDGIRLALPRVHGSTMDFYEVTSMDDLSEGAYHILEPGDHCPKVTWPEAVLLVPGLAFSREGHRLGKGGGYYDQYLEQYPHHKTIALAYEFQIAENIPAEAHDRAVEMVVTEHHVYRK